MTTPRPFLLERYFARYEFHTPLLLGSSDCEALTVAELLEGASAEERAAWAGLKLGYTESQGLPALRERIAAEYAGLGANDILTAAPQEILYLAMRALLRPGKRVVATFPGYQSLYELAGAAGCEVARWTPRETAQGWRFEVERLEELAAGGMRALIVNFPHNPTGASLTAEEWARVVRCAERCGAWLISDEMYRGLGCGLEPAAALTELGFSISGLSKAYGLAGLRTGWIATRVKPALEAMQAYKDYTTICGSAPGEWLALVAMGQAERLRARSRALITQNRGQVERFFAERGEWFEWRAPAAGPIAFPRLKRGTAERFCARLAEEGGVLLLPSTVYEWGDAHVRIGFGRANLEAALIGLGQWLDRAGEV